MASLPPASMACNRSREFAQLRSTARSRLTLFAAPARTSDPEDVRRHLLSGDALPRRSLKQEQQEAVLESRSPVWWHAYQTCWNSILACEEKLDDMRNTQERSQVLFFQERTSLKLRDQKFACQAADIVRLLSECDKSVAVIEKAARNLDDQYEVKVVSSCGRVVAEKTDELVNQLKAIQMAHLKSLKQQTTRSGNEAQSNQSQSNQTQTQSYQTQTQSYQTQMTQVMTSNFMVEDSTLRHEEIDGVIQSMEQVEQISAHIHQLISTQGTVLDRIDVDLETAAENTGKGKSQIANIETKQKSGFVKKISVALLIIDVILGLIVFIKLSIQFKYIIHWFKALNPKGS